MAMGCRGVMLEVVPLFQQSATSIEWTTGTGTTSPTLIYGSKKMLVHGIGHTLVNRVGSRAKLDEGSTQKVSACDGVHLAPKLSSA